MSSPVVHTPTGRDIDVLVGLGRKDRAAYRDWTANDHEALVAPNLAEAHGRAHVTTRPLCYAVQRQGAETPPWARWMVAASNRLLRCLR
ncbi:hypothetical protein ACFVWG_37085 [Kribbella sp. NPDC058245]|uniref:hypothetical protein n=1 Tax=Kribbella sp. NPDC058245 TaxID=3346399 RepID=UPI0036E9B637